MGFKVSHEGPRDKVYCLELYHPGFLVSECRVSVVIH